MMMYALRGTYLKLFSNVSAICWGIMYVQYNVLYPNMVGVVGRGGHNVVLNGPLSLLSVTNYCTVTTLLLHQGCEVEILVSCSGWHSWVIRQKISTG